MKSTLLGLVQDILSSMDSDEINSIQDSVESRQVATIVKTVYRDLLERANLPEHYTFASLDPSLDEDKPVLMTIPDTVNKVIWWKYNKATVDDPEIQMRPVTFKPLEEFLAAMYSLDTTQDNVASFTHTIGTSVITVLYLTDKAPDYYTTFDDYTILCDSYDSAVDTTLQSSKTMAYVQNVIPFTMSDTFTPDLDDQQFSLLYNEAKSLAWAELKQTQHVKAEVSANRGWVNLQRNKHRTAKQSFFDQLPDYGRK